MSVVGARAEFLAAGRDLLGEASLGDYLGRAITVDALCRRAGRSPGGFYHHWTSFDAYCRELLLTSVDEANAILADRLVNELSELPSTGEAAQLYGQLRSLLSHHVDTVLTTAWGAQAELLVWISDDEELRAALSERSGELDRLATELIPEALAALGRRLRPPWDSDMLVRAIAMILWGAQVFDRLRPSPVYRTMAVEMSLGVVALASRRNHSDNDVDDFLRLSLGVGRDEPTSEWADALRARTAPVVAALYRSGGWSAVTPAAVAQAADEYIQDIDLAWFGRSGFAAAVFTFEVVPELRSGLDDADAGSSWDVLVRHVEGLVGATRAHRDAATRFLSMAVSDSFPMVGPHPAGLVLTGMIEVTARAISIAATGRDDAVGELEGVDVHGLAATLIRLAISETLGRPQDDPDSIATDILALVGPALGGP